MLEYVQIFIEITKMPELLNQYQAVLIGGAIGDTIGMPVEGWHRDQIRRYVGVITEPINPVIVRDGTGNIVYIDETGRIPYVSPFLQKGQITDDTWLAIATARSIVESKKLDLDNLAKHSLNVFHQQVARQIDITPEGTSIAAFLHPNSEIPQAFGGTTIAAFEKLERGIPPTESGVMSRNPGNGPTIKVTPIGMYMHATDKYSEGLKFAELAGKMTHLDPRSVVSGVIQAHAVYSILSGANRNEFLDSAIDVCKKWEKSTKQGKKVTLLGRLKWISGNRDVDEESAYAELGVSWPVTRNYPFTLYMFQKYWDKPIEGLLKVVNAGGDCDSTAAMYGVLAGARHGMIFNESWVSMLEGKQELLELAGKIYNFKRKIKKL